MKIILKLHNWWKINWISVFYLSEILSKLKDLTSFVNESYAFKWLPVIDLTVSSRSLVSPFKFIYETLYVFPSASLSFDFFFDGRPSEANVFLDGGASEVYLFLDEEPSGANF